MKVVFLTMQKSSIAVVGLDAYMQGTHTQLKTTPKQIHVINSKYLEMK